MSLLRETLRTSEAGVVNIRLQWVLRDAGAHGGAESVARTLSDALAGRGAQSVVVGWEPGLPLTASSPAAWLLTKTRAALRRRRLAESFARSVGQWLREDSSSVAVLDPGSLPIAAYLSGHRRWGIHLHWSPDVIARPWMHIDSFDLPWGLRRIVTARLRRVGAQNLRLLQEAPFVVTLSNSQTTFAGALNPRVFQIPNPVRTAGVQRRHARDAGAPVTIGFVGRLSWEKGPDIFLEALEFLRPQAGAVTAVVAGAGPLEQLVRERAARLTRTSVDVLGWVDRPLDTLDRIDVLVSCSRNEAYPLVLVEALSRDCQVVATDAGSGVQDLLRNGRLGTIVQSQSPAVIAQAIESAVADVRAGLHADMDQVETLLAAHELGAVTEGWLDALRQVVAES